MNKHYLISIIMPIYNAETYLSNTIESVIKQSINFENIELILVDDKSTDNSKKIIKNYATHYNNIKPIYLEKNTGFPGNVRNKGLETATGDYIMFIDSDDEYQIDMCEKLYITLLENNCDCVKCNHIFINSSIKEKHVQNKNTPKIIILNPENALKVFDSYVWNKIFKKSIITKNNIKFVENCVGEDTYFCIDYYIHSKSIIHLDNYYGYLYFNRDGSFSTKKLKWILTIINDNSKQLPILNEKTEIDLYDYFDPSFYIYSSMNLVENNWDSIIQVLNEIYLIEKKFKFNNNAKLTFIIRFINYFIIKNHLNIATLIILIINRLRNIKILLKIYKKLL